MRSTPTAQVHCGHRERHQSARGTRPVSIYAGDRWDGWLGHDRRNGGGVSGAWRYRELGDAGWAWVLGSRGESHRSARGVSQSLGNPAAIVRADLAAAVVMGLVDGSRCWRSASPRSSRSRWSSWRRSAGPRARRLPTPPTRSLRRPTRPRQPSRLRPALPVKPEPWHQRHGRGPRPRRPTPATRTTPATATGSSARPRRPGHLQRHLRDHGSGWLRRLRVDPYRAEPHHHRVGKGARRPARHGDCGRDRRAVQHARLRRMDPGRLNTQ